MIRLTNTSLFYANGVRFILVGTDNNRRRKPGEFLKLFRLTAMSRAESLFLIFKIYSFKP